MKKEIYKFDEKDTIFETEKIIEKNCILVFSHPVLGTFPINSGKHEMMVLYLKYFEQLLDTDISKNLRRYLIETSEKIKDPDYYFDREQRWIETFIIDQLCELSCWKNFGNLLGSNLRSLLSSSRIDQGNFQKFKKYLKKSNIEFNLKEYDTIQVSLEDFEKIMEIFEKEFPNIIPISVFFNKSKTFGDTVTFSVNNIKHYIRDLFNPKYLKIIRKLETEISGKEFREKTK